MSNSKKYDNDAVSSLLPQIVILLEHLDGKCLQIKDVENTLAYCQIESIELSKDFNEGKKKLINLTHDAEILEKETEMMYDVLKIVP